MNRFKLFVAIIISMIPSNGFRLMAYRLIFKYRITNSKIGFGTIILVDNAEIKKSRVGRFNYFTGPFKITIEQNAEIGSFNTFRCGYWAKEDQYKNADYKREIKIGKNTLITHNHHFDLVGSFELKDNSWVAGKGSQFWTHGVGIVDRDIIVGKDCYIGSAVRFSPGAQLGDNVLVGIGSVVAKKFPENYLMIAGSPAKIIKRDFNWKEEKRVRMKS